jgi:hypothetical protein
MEQHEETNPTHYPLGRGYGHDYMRGGEVFGGYGYREREDYARTRGGDVVEIPDLEAPSNGGDPLMSSGATTSDDSARTNLTSRETERQDRAEAPVPELEHTYGDAGNGWRHSRSYYVTQAQLQQRFYGPTRVAPGPYGERLRALRRDDEDVRRDVQDALFYDTWVDAQRITVEVDNGRVMLRGELASDQEVRYACDDAWSVAGVREVVNEMSVGEEELGRS